MSDPHLAQIQAIYTPRSTSYDDSWHGVHAENVVRAASLAPGARVLDLACGTGLLSVLEARAVGPTGGVVGVDITPSMLGLAREKAAAAQLPITFLEHDITDLEPLRATLLAGTDGFDAITCACALVLLSDPPSAVRHWSSFLRPGGRLLLDVPAGPSSTPGHLLEVIAPACGVPLVMNQMWVQGPSSLSDVLTAAGLDVERVWRTEPYYHMEHGAREAGEKFDAMIRGPAFGGFAREEIRERARKLYMEKFHEFADADGVWRWDFWLYVGIGVRR